MLCRFCGHENSENARRCENCLEPVSVQPHAPRSFVHGSPSQEQPSMPASAPRVTPPPPPLPRSIRVTPPPPPPSINIRPQGAQVQDRRDIVRGTVNGFQERSEAGVGELVWVFNIDIYDAVGYLVQRVPVELRGYSFNGYIRDGDTVEAPGPWQQDRILKPDQVYNVRTGTFVGPTRSSRLVRKVMRPVMGVFAVALLGGIVITGVVMLGAYLMYRPDINVLESGFQPCSAIVRQVEFQESVVEQLTATLNNARDTRESDFWNQQLNVALELLQQRQRDLEQCRAGTPSP